MWSSYNIGSLVVVEIHLNLRDKLCHEYCKEVNMYTRDTWTKLESIECECLNQNSPLVKSPRPFGKQNLKLTNALGKKDEAVCKK
jgi:hypothetical protein